jgi:hypothetical protein
VLRQTITVTVQHVTTNRTGGRANDGDPVSLAGCVWWPDGSSEEFDRRDEVTTTSTLSVPFGSDIRPTDEITLTGDDTVWQVNGSNEPYANPFTGRQRGAIVNLQRTEG